MVHLVVAKQWLLLGCCPLYVQEAPLVSKVGMERSLLLEAQLQLLSSAYLASSWMTMSNLWLS